MEIAITGYHLVVGLSVICLALTVLIIALRYYFNQKKKTQDNQLWSSRTKHAAYDVYRHSGVFFRSGLICAMLLTLLAFNYTQYDYFHEVPEFIPGPWVQPITPPVVYPEPKPIPAPPASSTNDLIIEAVEDVAHPELVETKVHADVIVDPKASADNNTPNPAAPATNPPPLPAIEVVDEPVLISEVLPRMCSSCDVKDIPRKAKNDCATKEMMLFVQKQLKYPSMAREVGIQGMCPVRFIVRSDGSISDIELLRDIGAGCGKEALRVTTMLKDQCWQPGRQNGRKVSVQMVLPIRFQLQ